MFVSVSSHVPTDQSALTGLYLMCYLLAFAASRDLDLGRLDESDREWYWWGYRGIQGPDYWGQMNRKWFMCSETGKRQSPVNIDPERLLFDPLLAEFDLSAGTASGKLLNSGHHVQFSIASSGPLLQGGPLSYRYKVSHVLLHWGSRDGSGSEHLVANKAFSAEIQLFAYNIDLYTNMSSALRHASGIAAVSVLIKLSENLMDSVLEKFDKQLPLLIFRGDVAEVTDVNLLDLISGAREYVTYEGSMTLPACYETVTWIILNRPISMTSGMMARLRKLRRGTAVSRETALSDNFRFPQPLNNRVLRTNIRLNSEGKGSGCWPQQDAKYVANSTPES